MPSRTVQHPGQPDRSGGGQQPPAGLAFQPGYRRRWTTIPAIIGGNVAILLVGLLIYRHDAELDTRPSGPSRLAPGKSVHRSITRGDNHVYLLNLPSQAFATIELDQHEIDLVLQAQKPGGVSLGEINYSAFGREVISVLAEEAGTYQATVRTEPDSTARGSYELRLSVRPAHPDDAARILAQGKFAAAERSSSATAEGLAAAIDLYGAAVRFWHETGERRGEVAALMKRGVAYDRTGRWEDAYHCYHEAQQLSELVGDEYVRLQALRQIGRLKGHLGQAFSYVPSDAEFLHLWEKLGDRRGVADALSSLTGSRLRRARTDDEYRDVVDSANRAMALYRTLGDLGGERRALENLVLAYSKLKQYDRALDIAETILRLNQAAGDRRGVAASLVRIATALQIAGRHREAVPYMLQALPMQEAQGDRSAQQYLHSMLAASYLSLSEPHTALPYVRAVLALETSLRSDLRSPRFREGYSGLRDEGAMLVRTLMECDRKTPNRGYSLEAFLVADRIYSRLVSDKSPDSERARLSEIQQSLLDDNTVLLEYSLSNFVIEDVPQIPGRYEPFPSFVWLVTRTSLSVYALPDRRVIEPLVHQAYDRVSSPDQSTVAVSASRAEALQALSRLLLAPVASHLGRKRLLIAGGDVLEYVPFAALPDPGDAGGAPLIANHEITYLPSASVALSFRRAHPRSPRRGRLLAVLADPVFGRDDPRFRGMMASLATSPVAPDLIRAARAFRLDDGIIPRLPYSRREAVWVLQWSRPQESLSLMDFEASRAALLSGRLSDYRIVHIATHGFVNDQDPELTGLVLSLIDRNGRSRDGFLRLRDLYSLRLPAELVVLSACQSALGKVIGGEGLLSLTSGFLHAGAGAVLATTWKVDDEATAEFMNTFYAELLGPHHRTRSAALQAAQLSFINHPRWHAPCYWAAFALHAQAP